LNEFAVSTPDFVEDNHSFFGGLGVAFVFSNLGGVGGGLSLSGFFNQGQVVSVIGQGVLGGGQISLGSF